MRRTTEETALKANSARELRAEPARKIAFVIRKEENRITEISGVSLHRRTLPTPPCRTTIRAHRKPLPVEELTQLANRGVSTWHHHFRATTAMSPLQRQKQLRLQSARILMLNNGLDAATAACEVGSESATPRMQPLLRPAPMRDIRILRFSGGPASESTGREAHV